MKEGYIRGDNWVTCDRTGFKLRASETVLEWTGLRVGRDYVDERNPQDFLRVKPERIAADVQRPEPADQFIELVVPPVYSLNGPDFSK